MNNVGKQIAGGSLSGFFRMISLGASSQEVAIHRGFSLPLVIAWPTVLKKQMILIFLMLAILFSAFSMIYVKDINRRLMGHLQTLQMTRDDFHNRWSQLLLEESSLDNQARIQILARKNLDMMVPRSSDMIVMS